MNMIVKHADKRVSPAFFEATRCYLLVLVRIFAQILGFIMFFRMSLFMDGYV